MSLDIEFLIGADDDHLTLTVDILRRFHALRASLFCIAEIFFSLATLSNPMTTNNFSS
jgi:hypothetical protein